MAEKQVSNHEAFLRDKKMLLREYGGKFVAYAKGTFLESSNSFERLREKVDEKLERGVDVYVEQISEKAFGELEITDMSGLHEVLK